MNESNIEVAELTPSYGIYIYIYTLGMCLYVRIFSLFYIDKYIQSVIVNYYYIFFLVIHY